MMKAKSGYNPEGVMRFLTTYLSRYRSDVAQELRRGKPSADYQLLVQGARGQHVDPLVRALSQVTAKTPRDIFEAIIFTAAYDAERGVRRRTRSRTPHRSDH